MLAADRWAEIPRELPAPWVERHIDRLGGWRLAPVLLTDQLAGLGTPAPLVLTPRRQRRQLNSQCDYLGEAAQILVHPDDAADAGVADDQPVTVRSAHGEITGVAKVDPAIRRGAVSVPHGHRDANVNRLTSPDGWLAHHPRRTPTRLSGGDRSFPASHSSIRRLPTTATSPRSVYRWARCITRCR